MDFKIDDLLLTLLVLGLALYKPEFVKMFGPVITAVSGHEKIIFQLFC